MSVRLSVLLLCVHTCSCLSAGPAQGCGGYLSMPMGMISSPDPNLDGLYEPWMDCLWLVQTFVNRAVNLSFTSFQLETSSTCHYDHVKVATAGRAWQRHLTNM